MDFGGAFCGAFLTFVLPIKAYIAYFEKQDNLTKRSKYIHLTILFVFCTLSLITIIFTIIDYISDEEEPKDNNAIIKKLFHP